MLALVAGGSSACGARVQGALCRQVTAAYDPVDPTNRFGKETEKIYCAWDVRGSRKPVAVRGVWYADNVGNAAPVNYRIDEATVDIDRDSKGSFSLSRPTSGWPSGQYRLVIYLDAREAQVLRFSIQ